MPNIQPLIPELASKAESELGEVPARLEADLEHIKTWLSKQVHINARYDDQFLVAFLRGCKFSLERVKEKLDMYYTIRTAIPEFFANRDPKDSDIEYVIDQGVTLPLPYTETPDGARLFLIRIGSYDPYQTNIANIMKVCYMITDLLLWEDANSIISGHTILVDLRGLSFSHLSQFPAGLIRKMTTSIQEAYPIRQKGIHFVNPPTGFDALYKIFHSFMSEKLRKRLFIHDSFEALHKEVPKRLLPHEYGGEAGEISAIVDYWKGLLMKKREWFIEEGQFKTDERKRQGKIKNANAIFGIEGSFRSLEVD